MLRQNLTLLWQLLHECRVYLLCRVVVGVLLLLSVLYPCLKLVGRWHGVWLVVVLCRTEDDAHLILVVHHLSHRLVDVVECNGSGEFSLKCRLVFYVHARLVTAEVGHHILGIFSVACLVLIVQTVLNVYGVLNLGMFQLSLGKSVASCLLHNLYGSVDASLRIVGHQSYVKGKSILLGCYVVASGSTTCRHNPWLCLVR